MVSKLTPQSLVGREKIPSPAIIVVFLKSQVFPMILENKIEDKIAIEGASTHFYTKINLTEFIEDSRNNITKIVSSFLTVNH